MADSQLTKTVFRGEDLTGRTFGMWTVISFDCHKGKRPTAYWLCRCTCGREKSVAGGSLRRGDSTGCKSCGSRTHGMRRSTEYMIWAAMKARCQNPRHVAYPNYGGRGISVCERWQNSFETFIAEMGQIPFVGATIDRIDNSLGYSPDNCRWSTRLQQNRNSRHNHLLTFSGKTQCLAAWAEECGIPQDRLRNRLSAGWSIESALSIEQHKDAQ